VWTHFITWICINVSITLLSLTTPYPLPSSPLHPLYITDPHPSKSLPPIIKLVIVIVLDAMGGVRDRSVRMANETQKPGTAQETIDAILELVIVTRQLEYLQAKFNRTSEEVNATFQLQFKKLFERIEKREMTKNELVESGLAYM
jgi:hypothetical protein